jgi:hypothetical protein
MSPVALDKSDSRFTCHLWFRGRPDVIFELRDNKACQNFAMDGPRPLQELVNAESMTRVLKFCKPSTDEVPFAVDEILDPTGMCLATVVRPATDQDVRSC